MSPHVQLLYDQGIRLAVTNYHGEPDGGSSIGFVFGLSQGLTPIASPGSMNSKGVLDCAANRFTTIVIAWREP